MTGKQCLILYVCIGITSYADLCKLLAYNLTVAATPRSADFGLQFRKELGVALSLSPTLSALLAFQHTAPSRWQMRSTTMVLISREDHEDRVACN